jgi:GNAT superfamily N-acetyltransferase
MHNISLRSATTDDAGFVLHVTEVTMRAYAEQTWGRWNAPDSFDPSDMIVARDGRDIGVIAVDRGQEVWVLEKLFLLPASQKQGLGSYLLQCLIEEARSARAELRLTVLEVNPARRFYERHGFIVTYTVPPRRHMEWRAS